MSHSSDTFLIQHLGRLIGKQGGVCKKTQLNHQLNEHLSFKEWIFDIWIIDHYNSRLFNENLTLCDPKGESEGHTSKQITECS